MERLRTGHGRLNPGVRLADPAAGPVDRPGGHRRRLRDVPELGGGGHRAGGGRRRGVGRGRHAEWRGVRETCQARRDDGGCGERGTGGDDGIAVADGRAEVSAEVHGQSDGVGLGRGPERRVHRLVVDRPVLKNEYNTGLFLSAENKYLRL